MASFEFQRCFFISAAYSKWDLGSHVVWHWCSRHYEQNTRLVQGRLLVRGQRCGSDNEKTRLWIHLHTALYWGKEANIVRDVGFKRVTFIHDGSNQGLQKCLPRNESVTLANQRNLVRNPIRFQRHLEHSSPKHVKRTLSKKEIVGTQISHHDQWCKL